MDRLEEIKTLRDDAGFYKNLTIHEKATEQVDWLISEIERLRRLVKETYSEGWHDCHEHYKEYTIIKDWDKSKLKQELKEG